MANSDKDKDAQENMLPEDTIFSPQAIGKVDSNGNTLLHQALALPNPQKNLVSLLLKSGSDANALNTAGDSPLVIAVQNKCKYEDIRALMERGANINHASSEGRPLMCHILHNRNCTKEVVQLVIFQATQECSVHPNIFYCYMTTPNEIEKDILHLVFMKLLGFRCFSTQAMCIALGHPSIDVSIINMLEYLGCQYNSCLMHLSSFHCYLDEASHFQKFELQESILNVLAENASKGRVIYEPGEHQSSLCRLLHHPKCTSSMVKMLLKFDSFVIKCCNHKTPLHCYLGQPNILPKPDINLDILKALIEYNTDVINYTCTRGRSPLFMVLHYFACTSDAIQALLDSGATFNCPVHTTLMFCYVATNHIKKDAIETIFKVCPNLNDRDVLNDTPLHYALKFSISDIDAITLFLDHPDINIHCKGRNKASYLQCALQSPFVDIRVVKLLLERGASTNPRYERLGYYDPLLSAVSNPACSIKIIKLVLEHCVRIENNRGKLMLEAALGKQRNLEMISFILDVIPRGTLSHPCFSIDRLFNVLREMHTKTNREYFFMVLKFFILKQGSAEPLAELFKKSKMARTVWIRVPQLYPTMVNFLAVCSWQIATMTSVHIAPHLTLYDLVSTIPKGNKQQDFDVGNLVEFLTKNNISMYLDVIAMRIGKARLTPMLNELQLYVVVANVKRKGTRLVYVKNDVLFHLSNFLSVQDLMSFIIAYL